jgi:hypothetical protein
LTEAAWRHRKTYCNPGKIDAHPIGARHTIGGQPADQRPVLHSDHSPIVEGVYFSSAVSVHLSTAADTRPLDLSLAVME